VEARESGSRGWRGAQPRRGRLPTPRPRDPRTGAGGRQERSLATRATSPEGPGLVGRSGSGSAAGSGFASGGGLVGDCGVGGRGSQSLAATWASCASARTTSCVAHDGRAGAGEKSAVWSLAKLLGRDLNNSRACSRKELRRGGPEVADELEDGHGDVAPPPWVTAPRRRGGDRRRGIGERMHGPRAHPGSHGSPCKPMVSSMSPCSMPEKK